MASAFGSGAQAAFFNSAAFGANAIVTRINQQVFGTVKTPILSPACLRQLAGPRCLGPRRWLSATLPATWQQYLSKALARIRTFLTTAS